MDIKDIILTEKALNAIDSGVWIDDLIEAPGLRLLVTGLRSKEAQKAQEQKQAHLRLKNRGKPLTDAQLAKAMKEVLAEVVLKDWDGLYDNGQPVPYSKELATKLLTSRAGEGLASLVLAAAQKVDDQANDFAEEVKKN